MREQIGSVNLLEERVYPRYPVNGERQLTTRDEFVTVDAGVWPVYRGDDGRIYWEMEGELTRVEPTLENLGDGMYMSRNKVTRGSRVIFHSRTYTRDEFRSFLATDPLVVGDDSERRLVFEVVL